MISDDVLYSYISQAENAWLDTIPDEKSLNHSFSPRFEKKMRNLCQRTQYRTVYLVLQRAACILLVLLLCASMIFAFNPQVRATVIEWIKTHYDNFTHYLFAGGIHDSAPKTYEIGTPLDGYTFLDRIDTPDGGTVLYSSSDGRFLELSYVLASKGNTFSLITENCTYEQIDINGIVMELYISTDSSQSSAIIWDDGSGMIFAIFAYCDKEALMHLAQSVIPAA